MYITQSSRAEIKERAKETLREKYWYMFGFSLLVVLITGIASGLTTIFSSAAEKSTVWGPISFIVTWAVSLFVVIPINVGSNRFFINTAKGQEPRVDDLFYVYRNGLGNTVLTCFLETVYIFLWSLLLIVPGIIKTYQYFMIEYMLAENPRLDRKRAFEITKAAMTGDKWKAFVLGLSFIGWILLCCVTLGIGLFFLEPYVSSTMAHYYLELKEKAIANGAAQPWEFGD